MTIMADYLCLTDAQMAMWIAHMIGQDDYSYNISESIEISGDIDQEVFRSAVEATVQGIDTLRLRFVEIADGPRQYISRDLVSNFEFLDLSSSRSALDDADKWMLDDARRVVSVSGDDALFKFALIKIRTLRLFSIIDTIT
jgi:hypothetical protein